MNESPGYILLLGSGETSPNIRKAYDWLFRRQAGSIRAAVLETPAGFEPNSDYVAAQIGDYLSHRLQNYRPQISIVPARKRDTAFSPDDPGLMPPVYDANILFMGPGSPTYTVRQLQDSEAWHTLRARHRLGASLILASAATVAVGAQALPVYEIYKVGEDLHWKPGLDLFHDYNLNLVFIPHWNNSDGGDVLDTSRCYIGQDRFAQLVQILPGDAEDYTIVGIDENTVLIVDILGGTCQVMGPGGVTVIQGQAQQYFASGSTFAITELGPFQPPQLQAAGIPADVWQRTQMGMADAAARRAAQPTPSSEVMALVAERTAARAGKDWAASDRLRDEIGAAGWQVLDTAKGPVLEPLAQ